MPLQGNRRKEQKGRENEKRSKETPAGRERHGSPGGPHHHQTRKLEGLHRQDHLIQASSVLGFPTSENIPIPLTSQEFLRRSNIKGYENGWYECYLTKSPQSPQIPEVPMGKNCGPMQTTLMLKPILGLVWRDGSVLICPSLATNGIGLKGTFINLTEVSTMVHRWKNNQMDGLWSRLKLVSFFWARLPNCNVGLIKLSDIWYTWKYPSTVSDT